MAKVLNCGHEVTLPFRLMPFRKGMNWKCQLCSDRDATVNHLISEYYKLVPKKHKRKHVWVGKDDPVEIV